MEQDPDLPRWQPACLAGNARLRFETDSVELQAWLSCQPVTRDVSDAGNRTMALQLWADETLLLAEWPLGLLQPDPRRLASVGGRAPLVQPAGQARRRLALKLVSGHPGGWDQLHDCKRVLLPHRFLQPSLTGALQVHLEAGELRLALDGINNPRAAGELSGTLALELWALERPYDGGPFQGQPLGSLTLGRLGGQQQWRQLSPSWRWPDTAPLAVPKGQLTLMLREWTPAAYVTRDWRTLDWPRQPDGQAISVNRSTTARLRSVPGVSDKLARQLVASRPFTTLEQLQRVRGMSDRLYARLRDRLVL
jgi:hypothetical protein